MGTLNDAIQVLYNSSAKASTSTSAFITNASSDIGNIVYQLNNVYLQLVTSLADDVESDVLGLGLSGNVIFSDVNSTSSSSAALWTSALNRKRTIKESFDYFASEVVRLENLIDQIEANEYDDSGLTSDITELNLNLEQLALDLFGPFYTLDDDGAADLTWTLVQMVEAIGSLFTGFVPTGLTHFGTYPTLSFSVNLSDITIDDTLPQSAIEDLSTDLAAIRTFVGMNTATSTPLYSAYGPINIVTDGYSLERSIQELDQALTEQDLQYVYDNGTPGSRGEITLVSGNPLILKGPTGVASHQEWYDTTGLTTMAKMATAGLRLITVPLVLEVIADPAMDPSTGALYVKDVASKAELHYRDEDSNVVPITSVGRVVEYQVGYEEIMPGDLVYTAPTNEDTKVCVNMTYKTLDFTNANIEDAYIAITPPYCEDGSRPTQCRVKLFTVPNDAPAPGTYRYGFELFGNRKTGGAGVYELIAHEEAADVTWQSAGFKWTTNLGYPASEDFLNILSWTLDIESSAPDGFLPIRISRDPTNVSDTYAGDVGLVKVVITWWR